MRRPNPATYAGLLSWVSYATREDDMDINFPEMKTAKAILAWYENNHNDDHRPHLGASIIGRPCSRQIWYSWRWAAKKKVPGRLAKLFERGHLEEPVMAKALRGIGVDLHTEQPDGSQWSVSMLGGHFGGSMDGVGLGFPDGPKTWAIWENKTSNTKGFNAMVQSGVKQTKPEHYSQMTVYMGATNMSRAMYTMVCKETDDVYSEWVHFNKEHYEQLLAKAEIIIRSPEPPAGVSKDPSYYLCKMCDFADICHAEKPPEANCRTCMHSTPELDGTGGRWSCAKWQADIPLEAQRVGCDGHRYIPMFFERHSKPLGMDGDDVVYEAELDPRSETRIEWRQGASGITSAEIAVMTHTSMAAECYAVKAGLAQQGISTAKVVA